MTTAQRARATDTAMSEETRTAAKATLMGLPQSPTLPVGSAKEIRARIAQFCGWFGLEAPKTRAARGNLLATEELFEWITASGASWDWIACGDASAMAAVARRTWLQEREFLINVRKLSEAGQERVLRLLRVMARVHPGPEALELFRQASDANPELSDEEYDGLLDALAAKDMETLIAAAPESIMALFAEWQRKTDEANADSCTEERTEALLNEANAVEDRMMEIPSTTAQELASKILTWTANGGHALSGGEAPELWADIRRLAATESRPINRRVAATSKPGEARALETYREWQRVRAEWLRRAKAREAWDGPEMSGLYDRRFELENQAMQEAPTDPASAALLAAMLWAIDGPDHDLSEAEKRAAALSDYPAMKMKLRLLEWAETVLAPAEPVD